MSPAPSSDAYERLAAAAAAIKVPDDVLAVAAAPSADPLAGQIWRAVWEKTVQLLAITAVDEETVHAVPLCLEVYADTRTLLLPAGASSLEQPFALWGGLQQRLPWCVLDRQVSELTVPLPAVMHPPGCEPAPDLPEGTRWGNTDPVPASATAEYRALLADRLTTLRTAQWAPQGSGALPSLLQDAGVTTRTLAAELNLDPARALAVRRGQQPLNTEQATLLAALLHLNTDEILAANPALPQPVVHELSRPQRRARLRTLAATYQESEHQARLRAAYGIFALAARQDERATADWTGRTDRYFELHLP